MAGCPIGANIQHGASAHSRQFAQRNTAAMPYAAGVCGDFGDAGTGISFDAPPDPRNFAGFAYHAGVRVPPPLGLQRMTRAPALARWARCRCFVGAARLDQNQTERPTLGRGGGTRGNGNATHVLPKRRLRLSWHLLHRPRIAQIVLANGTSHGLAAASSLGNHRCHTGAVPKCASGRCTGRFQSPGHEASDKHHRA